MTPCIIRISLANSRLMAARMFSSLAPHTQQATSKGTLEGSSSPKTQTRSIHAVLRAAVICALSLSLRSFLRFAARSFSSSPSLRMLSKIPSISTSLKTALAACFGGTCCPNRSSIFRPLPQTAVLMRRMPFHKTNAFPLDPRGSTGKALQPLLYLLSQISNRAPVDDGIAHIQQLRRLRDQVLVRIASAFQHGALHLHELPLAFGVERPVAFVGEQRLELRVGALRHVQRNGPHQAFVDPHLLATGHRIEQLALAAMGVFDLDQERLFADAGRRPRLGLQ